MANTWVSDRSEFRTLLLLLTADSCIYITLRTCFLGTAHGSKVEKEFVFQNPAKFVEGTNQIILLAYLVGFPVRIYIFCT